DLLGFLGFLVAVLLALGHCVSPLHLGAIALWVGAISRGRQTCDETPDDACAVTQQERCFRGTKTDLECWSCRKAKKPRSCLEMWITCAYCKALSNLIVSPSGGAALRRSMQ